MFTTRCSRLRKKMVQNKTIFSVHIVYMYIVYIYRNVCFYAHFNFSHVFVKYLFRNGNFCNENYPPPPINLIFLVCCYSMSFHLNNNSSILACYIYTHVSSPFLLILVFLYAFCKEYTGIQKIYSTYL